MPTAMLAMDSGSNKSEVNGEIIQAFINGIAIDKYREMSLRILSQHGLKNPKPGQWYSHAAWLQALNQASHEMGPNTLFMIGKKIPQTIQMPLRLRVVRTMEEALANIDVIYQQNHRFEQTEPGTESSRYHYKVEKVGPTQVKIVCQNPYPADVNRGIIVQIARSFDPTVQVTPAGGAGQAFLVVWGDNA